VKTRNRANGKTKRSIRQGLVAVSPCVLFHPDYTVGFGLSPNLLTLPHFKRQALAGSQVSLHTAGGESHPALRTSARRYGEQDCFTG
jgi:hypothetical protein